MVSRDILFCSLCVNKGTLGLSGKKILAPTHRFNVGVFWDIREFYANANVNYQDEAFWTDVMDSRFWGPTDSFAILNVGIGARIYRQRMTVSLNAQNLFDEYVQQHVWSDIISRKITGQVTYRF